MSSPGSRPPTSHEDEFRYGWRYVQERQPDGTVSTVQRGLTQEEVLHPEEGDFIVQTHLHHRFVLNLALSVGRLLLGRAGVRYRVDCRIDWGHESIRPHGPDVVVLDNGDEPNPAAGTIELAALGSRPLVVFEVTSPSTRDNDLGVKREHYFAVGVPLYVIVDLGPDPEKRLELRVFGYQAGPARYERLPLDEANRLHVEALGLVLAVENDWLCCYDEDGNVLANEVEIERLVAEQAERIAVVEGELEAQIERARQAEAQRIAEEGRRQEAETRRQEAETQRLQEEALRKEAETQRLQEEALRKEAEAQRQAEAALREEAEAQRRAEETLRREAEAQRQQAEEQRRQAEALRQEAEARKKEEEDRRKAAETDRLQEEERRKAAEADAAAAREEVASLLAELARLRASS